MSIKAYQVTYDENTGNGQVPAVADRRLYDSMLSVNYAVGFIREPSTSVVGHAITITNGWGVILGCAFEIDSETVNVTPASTAQNEQLVLKLNVTDSSCVLETKLASDALTMDDINNGGSIYEMQIGTYSNTPSGIQDFTLTAERIRAVGWWIRNLSYDLSGVQLDVANLQSSKTNTKVKGANESTYRTGNVNLTPANLGAVPTTRTINGKALSNNITLNGSDIGLENVNPTIVATAAMDAHTYLQGYWSTFPTGISLISLTEDSSTNKRHTIIVNKISNSTGQALSFTNVREDGKGVIRLHIYASGMTTIPFFSS